MSDYFQQFRRLLPAAEKYTYLNSAGCGPLATPVLDIMTETFAWMAKEGQVNVTVHRELKEMLEEVRKDVARFIHADPEEIFFVRCIAEGLNLINRMFSWEPGDEILISDQENPASILPCFVLEPETGIRTTVFSGLGNGEDIVEQFSRQITDRTRMAVMSHVFHTTGAAIPAKEICAKAARRNVITVLDGAQASGNIKIDVKEIGCNFYLLSCHKWLCGPEGVAAVYIQRDWLERVKLPFGGVGIQESFDFAAHTIVARPDARRFEYGGRHIPMYRAFSECIRLAEKIGMDQIVEKKRQLHHYCRGKFQREVPEARIVSPEEERLMTGIFSFFLPHRDHRKIVGLAWEQEQMILQWRTLNLYTGEEGIRVSLNWFVTEEEIDRLVSFIRRILDEDQAKKEGLKEAPKEKVAVIKVQKERPVEQAIRQALEALGGIKRFVKPGQSVMIKPNYTGNLPEDSGGVTSNAVMESIFRILREAKAGRIAVLEGCGTIALGTKRIFENLGIDQIAKKYDVELLDANQGEMCTRSHPDFRELCQVTYVREIEDFDLVINVPVMKTHPLVDITVAVKNMNGLLEPKEKRHFHEINLRQAIVDFHKVLPSYLTIVDGITAMEGMGPAEGMPVPLGIIMAGANPVAVDATAARIMGFNPENIRYLQYAVQDGLGPVKEKEIEVCGNSVEEVRRPFRPAEPEELKFDGIEIREEKSELNCIGCRAVASIALNRIQAAGQMDAFAGMKVVFNGVPQEEIRLEKGERLFCIGNCVKEYADSRKNSEGSVHFIKGCAPAGLTVEDAIRDVYGVPRANVEMTAARKDDMRRETDFEQ